MEKKKLISNLQSKYILNYIFSYIKDNIYKEKLFLYSKKLQLKFDIKLYGLKEKYLKKIDFDKFLYIKPYLFSKNALTIKYNNFLKEGKINKEIFENFIYDIYENKQMKDLDEEDIDEEDIDKIKNNEHLINFESPLFQILSKTKNFSKIFTIYISQNIMDDHKLKNQYIEFFNNMNNLDIKYSSIFYDLKNLNKINYLKEINIDFNKIKRLTLKIENIEYYERIKDINNFFKNLFSFNNIKNNLIYLEINFGNKENNSDSFKDINNFKSLRYLHLENFNFNQQFTIRSNNLILLSIISCENILLSEIPNEKLKVLNLRNHISNINRLGRNNPTELTKINLSLNKIDINILEKVDFKNLKVLNLINNEISNINILEKVNFIELSKLNLSFNKISDIKVFEKVNFRELKELNLSNNRIFDINILGKVNFKKLNKLNLMCNEISDINILGKVNFKELEELYLGVNEISNINILGKVNFKNLTLLDLSYNEISDIKILTRVKFKELKYLYLVGNEIL